MVKIDAHELLELGKTIKNMDEGLKEELFMMLNSPLSDATIDAVQKIIALGGFPHLQHAQRMLSIVKMVRTLAMECIEHRREILNMLPMVRSESEEAAETVQKLLDDIDADIF